MLSTLGFRLEKLESQQNMVRNIVKQTNINYTSLI